MAYEEQCGKNNSVHFCSTIQTIYKPPINSQGISIDPRQIQLQNVSLSRIEKHIPCLPHKELLCPSAKDMASIDSYE